VESALVFCHHFHNPRASAARVIAVTITLRPQYGRTCGAQAQKNPGDLLHGDSLSALIGTHHHSARIRPMQGNLLKTRKLIRCAGTRLAGDLHVRFFSAPVITRILKAFPLYTRRTYAAPPGEHMFTITRHLRRASPKCTGSFPTTQQHFLACQAVT
jgi:hypothetical protein